MQDKTGTSCVCTITPLPLTAESFAPYGKVIHMQSQPAVPVLGTHAYLTEEPLANNPLSLGVTEVSGGKDFTSRHMERHFMGEEVIVCCDDDMVVTVAASNPEKVPQAQDVRCFYMRTGDVVVLGKGIWHDANHGVHTNTQYYFLAQETAGKPGGERETEWVGIVPGPVQIRLVP